MQTTTGETKHREETFFLDETLDCTVAEVHGMPEPGRPDIPVQYVCSTDDGETLFIDGDAIAVLGDQFESGHTRMSVPSSAVSINGYISLDQAQGAIAVSNDDHSHSRRKLTRVGTYKVLVIRVVSSAYAPSQSEAQMYDDVFADTNNLVSTCSVVVQTYTINNCAVQTSEPLLTLSIRFSFESQQKVRYEECSNGKLNFEPATGTGVNNGVITVTTSTDLNGLAWQSCGNIATSGASGISRDYTMVICPDVVDFAGAAAWGQAPGSLSWYRSVYASGPIVQVHEVVSFDFSIFITNVSTMIGIDLC